MPTHRERVVAVIEGERPDRIVCLGECPMDVTVFRDLMPVGTGDAFADAIRRAEFFGNSAVGVGIGVRSTTLSRDDSHHLYRYETGAVWREDYAPTFCREALEFPVNSPEDTERFTMPDACDPGRVDDDQLRRRVERFHESGYFVQGSVPGAWQGIYYYLTSFDNILAWMAVEPAAAHRLFEAMSRFSLDAARRLLAAGVDAIFPPSDLGSGRRLLFSPAMFREYVFPWLRDLAGLCHDAGAYLHLHSHGHIEDIMDGIVEAGVDIINPIGPSDHNDLGTFKERWGRRIVLHGGISTTIGQMKAAEIREHVRRVIDIGRRGGRFFPRTESGIPPMSPELARVYIETLEQECKRGYVAGGYT